MKNELKHFYNKFKDKIVITLAILLILSIIALFSLLAVDGNTKKIDKLEIEKSAYQLQVKDLTDSLKTEKQIKDNYKQYYKDALQRIYEYEQAFNLIKSKNNEKIKNLPRLSDAQLDEFFSEQAREWSISQSPKGSSNRP